MAVLRAQLVPLFVFQILWSIPSLGTPAPAHYFEDQIVDHNCNCVDKRWKQRYYIWDKEWKGPGHPIFLIMGGEGNIEPSSGIFYPFISHHLAKDFGAFVLEPEHRFYGESMPVEVVSAENDPRETLFTTKQALQDAMLLTRHYQEKLGCSLDKSDPMYCPVISVGGSYPGYMSAMSRLLFPDTVDMAYAASAPMTFYSQEVHVNAYYDHITEVAEKSQPGCSASVRDTLDAVSLDLEKARDTDIDIVSAALGFCQGTIPEYIKDMKTFTEELFMIIGYTFANLNMANYPPGDTTRLYQACTTFIEDDDPIEKVYGFLLSQYARGEDCVDFRTQLPTGHDASVSAGDWSGVGFGTSGESWDFQTCTLLVEKIGFSAESMFPERKWTYEWLRDHCQKRFGVTPKPWHLVREWHFDDLAGSTNASHIIFTNGLNDGWSVGGIKEDLSDTLLAINFHNGAHHSDLSHDGPSERDTPDIKKGFDTIRNILMDWLNTLQPGRYPVYSTEIRSS